LRLRQAKPNAHITLLTPEKLADLWQRHSALDSVLTFSATDGAAHVAAKIRAGRFQSGVAFPNSFRSALELWWGRVPRRIGYRGAGRNWLLTERVLRLPGFVRMHKLSTAEIQRRIRSAPPALHSAPEPPRTPELVENNLSPPLEGRGQGEGWSRSSRAAQCARDLERFLQAGTHQIHHYLQLVAALGANPAPVAPQLAVSDTDVIAVRKKFLLPEDKPLLGLNPGAEYGPAKRWPTERFIEAAVALQAAVNCRWLIFGGGNDLELTASIEAELARHATHAGLDRPINLAGRTSLRELCAGLKACRVLLTNDTGPMHVAAAVGTPVVAIFGSTSPAQTAPGLPGDSRHRVLISNAPCSPCYRRACPIDFRCMHGVGVETVVQAALEVWRSRQ
jgi:heptosyltransferase-2